MSARSNTAASVMVKLTLRMVDLPDPMRVDVGWNFTDEDMSASEWTGKVQVTPEDFPAWLAAFEIDPFSVETRQRSDKYTEYSAVKDAVRILCLRAGDVAS